MTPTTMDNGDDDFEEGRGEEAPTRQCCSNCGAACDNYNDHNYHLPLCRICISMRCCHRCKRRLPDVCFADVRQDTCEVNSCSYSCCCCCCLLWSPYVIGQTIIFLPCDFYLSSFFLSSPNLSRRRLDVYHTSTHGVALVRI